MLSLISTRQIAANSIGNSGSRVEMIAPECHSTLFPSPVGLRHGTGWRAELPGLAGMKISVSIDCSDQLGYTRLEWEDRSSIPLEAALFLRHDSFDRQFFCNMS